MERRRIRAGGARGRAAQMEKIPAFGDWEFVHDDNVPITQYFECCYRQHQQQNHSLSPTVHASVYPHPGPCYHFYPEDDDALFFNSMFPTGDNFHGLYYGSNRPLGPPPSLNIMGSTGGGRQVKEECGTRRRRRRHRRSCLENRNRVFHVNANEAFPTPTATESSNGAVAATPLADVDKFHHSIKQNVKAKDEDLYKIPPELLRNSKPKRKVSKFFTKCFVTICASN